MSFCLKTEKILLNKASGKSIMVYDGQVTEIPIQRSGIFPSITREGLMHGHSHTSDSLYRYENDTYIPVMSTKGRIIRNIVSWEEIYFTDRASNSKLFVNKPPVPKP